MVGSRVRLKPVYSATKTSWNIEIQFVASLVMIISREPFIRCGQTGQMPRLVSFYQDDAHIFLDGQNVPLT